MNKSALAPAFAAALLTAFVIAAWSFWPASAPEPSPAQAIPTDADQFPGITPSECLSSAPQETSE